MNEKLHFSWGHIIFFVALIAIGYMTFAGAAYLSEGDFVFSGIATAVILVILLLWFFVMQQFKGAGKYIRRKIIAERILFYSSPFVFAAGMYYTCHFWTVYSQNDKVIDEFTESIDGSRQLFDDYEAYARERIENYRSALQEIVDSKAKASTTQDAWQNHRKDNPNGKNIKPNNSFDNARKDSRGKSRNNKGEDTQPAYGNTVQSYSTDIRDVPQKSNYDSSAYTKLGFKSAELDTFKINNMVEVLRLQLLSDNFYNLKKAADKWITESSDGATTLNVFLLGNTREINEAIENWKAILDEMSAKRMTGEEILNLQTDFNSEGADDAIDGIQNLTSRFKTRAFPTVIAIIVCVVLYLMMIFPWLIQTRHSRSWYTLFHNRLEKSQIEIPMDDDDSKPDWKSKNKQTDSLGTFRLD